MINLQTLSQLYAALKRPKGHSVLSVNQATQADLHPVALRNPADPWPQGTLQQPLPNLEMPLIPPGASQQQQQQQLHNEGPWAVDTSVLGAPAAAAEAAQHQTHSGAGPQGLLQGLPMLICACTVDFRVTLAGCYSRFWRAAPIAYC